MCGILVYFQSYKQYIHHPRRAKSIEQGPCCHFMVLSCCCVSFCQMSEWCHFAEMSAVMLCVLLPKQRVACCVSICQEWCHDVMLLCVLLSKRVLSYCVSFSWCCHAVLSFCQSSKWCHVACCVSFCQEWCHVVMLFCVILPKRVLSCCVSFFMVFPCCVVLLPNQ